MTQNGNGHRAYGQEELGARAQTVAKDAGRELLERVNETGARGLNALGEGLDQAAELMARRAREAASEGRLPVPPEQLDAVTDSLHGAARYLKETDPKGVLGDIDAAIQAHPYRALAVGAAVGGLVGRLMSRD